MSSRFSPKSGIRLVPGLAEGLRGGRGPRPTAGRVTIAERGVMISETSRRVSSTACWSSSRVDSGRSASTSSGSSASAGISTSTLAGRGGASAGAGEPVGERLDQRGRRTVSGQVTAADARRRPARARRCTGSAKTRPIDPGQRRSPTAPTARAIADHGLDREARARRASARHAEQRGQHQAGERPPAPRRLRSVASSSMGDRRRPARDGRARRRRSSSRLRE